MDAINPYLVPGTYQDDAEKIVVVLDVITHGYNSVHGLQEVLPSPLVVVVDLVRPKEHLRYTYPIEVFLMKFKKI